MQNKYYMVKSIDYEIEKKEIFIAEFLLPLINGEVSKYGINISSPFVILKEKSKIKLLGTIFEIVDEAENFEYKYEKITTYLNTEIKIKELQELLLKDNNELIEIQEDRIIIMEKNE